MSFQDKLDRFKKVSDDMASDLKPIFERLVAKSDEYIEEHSSLDTSEYAPTCGITERSEPLTAEQKNELDRQIDITKNEIMEDPDKYKEIKGMASTAQGGQGGEGKGTDRGYVAIKKLPYPKWLDEIKSNVQDYLHPKKGRKGLDYEAIVSGRIRKPKEKIITQDNSLYVLLDTSGSMWYYKDRHGNSLIKLFSSFFPTIAQKFKGQIWMVDYAPMNDPIPIERTYELSDFTGSSMKKKLAIGGGGGTDFWGAFQIFKKKELALKEKNPDAKVMMIMLSDLETDLESHPELIPENIIFVTVEGMGKEAMPYINGVNRKLIFMDVKESLSGEELID